MNRLENFRGRFTGPRAKLAAGGTVALFVAAAGCTSEQIAMVEKAFPCPPADTASIGGEAGTGTELVSGEVGDSQTAVVKRTEPIEIPLFLTNQKRVVVCFPTGEQAIARPTPTPEATTTPLNPKTLLEKAITQKRGEISDTGYRKVERKINAIWNKHKEEIKTYTKYNIRSEFIDQKTIETYLKHIKQGFGGSNDISDLEINQDRAFTVADFTGLLAGIYGQTDNSELKADLETAVDTLVDYGYTGITNNERERNKLKAFIKELIEKGIIPLLPIK